MLSGNRIGRYLLYALGEIVLVVLGILIALQINNWNADRKERKEEVKSCQNIRRQLLDDQEELLRVRAFNNYYTGQYETANEIISSNDLQRIDSLAIIAMKLSQYSDFNRSGNIYETLVNSGDIKLLKNSQIPGALQRLEMTYTYVNKLEDIHWDIIMKEFSPEIRGVINYATLEIVRPEKLYSVEIQNILIECIFLTKGKEAVYNKALDEIETIIELINLELQH